MSLPVPSPRDLQSNWVWGVVAHQMMCHQQPSTSHDWLQTLTRLWRKNAAAREQEAGIPSSGELPYLSENVLSARFEGWSLAQIKALLHPNAHKRDVPKCDTCPIVVLTWRDKHFLIDGTTRINRRVRDNSEGPHSVIHIFVTEPT
jgi:hypothetical protein